LGTKEGPHGIKDLRDDENRDRFYGRKVMVRVQTATAIYRCSGWSEGESRSRTSTPPRTYRSGGRVDFYYVVDARRARAFPFRRERRTVYAGIQDALTQ
jgi:hypothetical protein